MAKTVLADRPVGDDDREYHIGVKRGALAPHCTLVGKPERARLIAEEFLSNWREVGNCRGFLSFTGMYRGLDVSVVSHGIGSASFGTVLPEIVRCGGRRLIRVGSCATLQPEPMVGEVGIVTGAVRLEGASKNWAPIEYPAFADHRVINALVLAAGGLGYNFHLGIEATTDDFNEGQARPDDSGYIPPRLQAQHEELTRRGVLMYSMEAAALFVWCHTHPPMGKLWAGAINAIYANRVTNELRVAGDAEAGRAALDAMVFLNELYPLE